MPYLPKQGCMWCTATWAITFNFDPFSNLNIYPNLAISSNLGIFPNLGNSPSLRNIPKSKDTFSGVFTPQYVQVKFKKLGVLTSYNYVYHIAIHLHIKTRQNGRLGMADMRRIYGRYAADMRLLALRTYGGHTPFWCLAVMADMADIRRIYGWHTANMRRIYEGEGSGLLYVRYICHASETSK